MRTKRNSSRKLSGTRRRYDSSSATFAAFQKEITVIFLEMLMMVKLYHWKTTSYATHKATDELYSKLNENIDKFIEILLGKTGLRTDLMSTSEGKFKLIDLSNQESLKREVDAFKGYLVSLNDNKAMQKMSNTDLYNVRDEILGDLNQFLYLLTFK
jgi:hypothetical protein